LARSWNSNFPEGMLREEWEWADGKVLCGQSSALVEPIAAVLGALSFFHRFHVCFGFCGCVAVI
jgi:hypothetical protein